MAPTWTKHGWKAAGLAMVLAFAGPAAVRADDYDAGCCQHFHCPHTKVCVEGPPKICFKQGCAKPIVNPCNLPNWGYYQPCWAPWPWPPDWSHCPVQPPATMVFPPSPPVVDTLPNRWVDPNTVLPTPRSIPR